MGWRDAPVVEQSGGWRSAPVADAAPAEEPGMLAGVLRTARDIGAGAVRGAGSIGATLLSPIDAAARALNDGQPVNIGGFDIVGQDRRAGMDAGLRSLGADTDSLAFRGGKLGAEVAGTLGTGGVLANTAVRVAPGAAAAFPGMVNSIRSAGMSAGMPGAMGARVTGGALTGGASAGLVNPDDVLEGAALGGALPAVTRIAGATGRATARGVKGAVQHGLGMSTGVGAEPVAQAFRAGKAGNQAFLQNMRGKVPIDDVLQTAKSGLANMRAERAAQYRSGMVPIKGDKTVLQFADIDAALNKAADIVAFKGQVKSPSAAAAVEKMREVVEEWRSLNPAEFHTPEGLDALKQRLGDIVESLPFENRQARMVAGDIYSATKKTIEQQAPTYARVMRDYTQQSELIREIERALSLGNKSAADTSMRKLQSLMRNNVQTNYGNRLSLAESLESGGNVEIMPSLAGQAMSSATPRSLAGQIGGGATTLGALMTGNPAMLAALPLQSPRVVGELAYGAGRAARSGNALLQLVPGGPTQQSIAGPSPLLQMIYRAAPVVAAGQ